MFSTEIGDSHITIWLKPLKTGRWTTDWNWVMFFVEFCRWFNKKILKKKKEIMKVSLNSIWLDCHQTVSSLIFGCSFQVSPNIQSKSWNGSSSYVLKWITNHYLLTIYTLSKKLDGPFSKLNLSFSLQI